MGHSQQEEADAVQSDNSGFNTTTFQTAFSPSLLKLPLARYGGRQTVTVLPGDGIGPEMLSHVREIFAAAQVPVDFEKVELDSHHMTEDEDMENAIMSIERNGVALKGNVEPKYDDPTLKSRNVELRRRLDLFANVLWCKTIPGVPAKHKDVDVIIIRENTEGEYSGMEHETVPGVVESLKIVTRRNIERISRFAFEYALKYNRKKVTAVHKANIMKIADGLFLQVCTEMASNYKTLEFDNMIVDNTSMQLVQYPQQFDVMVMPNLYGNIVSNIACGVVGGPGLVSGSNIGERYAIFETGTRNTGTRLVGTDSANPTAFLRAGIDMLRYLKLTNHADIIEIALMRTLIDKAIHTPDIGGQSTSSEFVQSIVDEIGTQMK